MEGKLSMIRLAIDAMGGDHAPEVVIEGVKQALATYSDIEITLFGPQEELMSKFDDLTRLVIVDASEKITGEDDPVKTIRKKKDSSLVKAAYAVKDGHADALISAGNTGALLAAGLLIIGRLKGIERPGLMPLIPTINPSSPYFILMDAGANADAKAIYLYQHALLANQYAQSVLKIEAPRISLLNNGAESGKGDKLRKEVYEQLEADQTLNFVGNIESKDLLAGNVDIVITDGFTGNAVLKSLEGTAKAIFKLLKEGLVQSGLKTKVGAFLVKDRLKQLAHEFDDSKQGGAVLLGVNNAVVKAHGSSDDQAIFNAIRQTREIVQSQAIEKMKNIFNKN
ncbi:phosphate acyltransferase PlsX [Facklamia hominis]